MVTRTTPQLCARAVGLALSALSAGIFLCGCGGATWGRRSVLEPSVAPCSEAVPPASPRLIMPAPSHELVNKLFPKSAAVLPRARFETLSGNGLDRDILIRQSVAGAEQWLYVINPGWWWERVDVKIESEQGRKLRDPVLGQDVVPRHEEDGAVISLDLDPWSIKVLVIEPPTGVLCATVFPDETVSQRVEQAWRDIEAMLPYLATRRPNLIPNGDFEQVDTKGFPAGWRLFGWRAANIVCTTELREGPPPTRLLRLNNAKSNGTIGIYTPKFALAPGREYTFVGRMASDRPNIRGRIALVGSRYMSQGFNLDTRWREITFVWPAAETASLPVDAKVRAEIHNDGCGTVYVDDLRLVDSTFVNYSDSVATEQAVAEAMKAQPGRRGTLGAPWGAKGSPSEASLCQALGALANPRLARLGDMVKRRRAGNEWLLIGPFDSAAGGLNGVYPPETDFLKEAERRGAPGAPWGAKGPPSDLTQTVYTGKDRREVKGIADWTIKNGGAPDYIDLQASIGPFDASEAFAFTQVYSDANKKAKLLIGCDDGARVWLNDAAVFTIGGERGAKPGEFIVPVTLRRGWNRVLVKVENIQKDWGFFFTLADEAGVRVTGARYAVRVGGE